MASSFKRQTHVFKDDHANIGTPTPSTNFDSPRTRACKLHSVQGKPNKKLEKKKGDYLHAHLQLQLPLVISHMW